MSRRRLLAAALGAAWLTAARGVRASDEAPAPPLRIAPSVRAALALQGDAGAGLQAYASCAVCHGPDGAGRSDGIFPRIAGQHRSVLVKQLVDIREGRRANPIMEPWAKQLLDDRDVADVASYVASLPVPPPRERGPAVDPVRGESLYRRDCARCHGARGEGDPERFVPVLAGQHPPYLLREIRAIAAGRVAPAHRDMVKTVSDYSDADLQAVADHASRLPGPEGSARPEPGP